MKATAFLCAVLGMAASANALDFELRGAVDMGGPGGFGQSITGDFTGINPAAPLAILGVGARIGDPLNPLVVLSGASATDTLFSGVYALPGGVTSQADPGGFDAVAIFDAATDAPISAPLVYILIRDNSGTVFNIAFQGVGSIVSDWTPGTSHDESGPTQPLTQPYRLAQYGRTLYLEAIPAPGAASLLGMGLIAACRRRR